MEYVLGTIHRENAWKLADCWIALSATIARRIYVNLHLYQ